MTKILSCLFRTPSGGKCFFERHNRMIRVHCDRVNCVGRQYRALVYSATLLALLFVHLVKLLDCQQFILSYCFILFHLQVYLLDLQKSDGGADT